MNLMRATALGLGLELNSLDEYVDKADNTFRWLHYPRV